jgi:hypothetical protein
MRRKLDNCSLIEPLDKKSMSKDYEMLSETREAMIYAALSTFFAVSAQNADI